HGGAGHGGEGWIRRAEMDVAVRALRHLAVPLPRSPEEHHRFAGEGSFLGRAHARQSGALHSRGVRGALPRPPLSPTSITKAPRRVLHIVPALFDEKDGIVGGAERYAWELARHMAQEVETTLLSFGSADRVFSEGHLRVRVLGRPWHVRGSRFNPLSMRVL